MAPAIIVALGVLTLTPIAVRPAASQSREELLQQASGLNTQGGLLYQQGRYADAERLYKRALAIWEKTLGPEHPYVATGLNNLAQVYEAEGRYAEAEPLYKRALAIWEKALGPEHRDVATGLNNLAHIYEAEGRYADAELLFKRTLALWEKALGSEHPDVAISVASFYLMVGSLLIVEILSELRRHAGVAVPVGRANPTTVANRR